MNSKQNGPYFFKLLYKGFKAPLFILFFLTSHLIFAQVDFLGISSITLDKQVYELKWSVNVYQEKIIEEYLLPQESITRYKTKLILECSLSGETIKDIVEAKWAKLAELENGRQGSRVLYYKKLENSNPNEVIFEFMIARIDNREIYNVEWNVYRYKSDAGRVLLFAMSKRANEKESVNPFMEEVNKNRLNWVNSIINYELPQISVED